MLKKLPLILLSFFIVSTILTADKTLMMVAAHDNICAYATFSSAKQPLPARIGSCTSTKEYGDIYRCYSIEKDVINGGLAIGEFRGPDDTMCPESNKKEFHDLQNLVEKSVDKKVLKKETTSWHLLWESIKILVSWHQIENLEDVLTRCATQNPQSFSQLPPPPSYVYEEPA